MLTGVFGWTLMPPRRALCGDQSRLELARAGTGLSPDRQPGVVECRYRPTPGDWPSTLGTGIWLCVPETVSTTVTFCLTLVPPAGVCEMTVPTGL